MCLCNGRKCSSFRQRVKPSFGWFFWDGIPYGTISFINWINRKSCTQHTYTIFLLTFVTH